jgi:eukaryotic-like serine/threonine-protein kinase
MERVLNIIAFIRTRTFWFHFAFAVGIVIVLLSTIYFSLDNYTNHGESISVPSFKGLTINQLDQFVEDKNIEYVIVDSVYNPGLPKGVIDQDPKPDEKVKEGRKVYLTINSVLPPQIKMPNLIDVSDRQAEAILQTYGLKMGQKIFKPDLAKNAVLEQLYRGAVIKPGTGIKKGSVIDLVIGDGRGNTVVNVPKLINLTFEEATFVLQGSSLNLGAAIYDETVKDSAAARVYKQSPSYLDGGTISQGDVVDIYLTQSADKIKEE